MAKGDQRVSLLFTHRVHFLCLGLLLCAAFDLNPSKSNQHPSLKTIKQNTAVCSSNTFEDVRTNCGILNTRLSSAIGFSAQSGEQQLQQQKFCRGPLLQGEPVSEDSISY